jgi:hypothetical protein
MDEKDTLIKNLKMDLAKWRGRAIEAAEMACSKCKMTDLELCRHCRMEKIRKEAGQ